MVQLPKSVMLLFALAVGKGGRMSHLYLHLLEGLQRRWQGAHQFHLRTGIEIQERSTLTMSSMVLE